MTTKIKTIIGEAIVPMCVMCKKSIKSKDSVIVLSAVKTDYWDTTKAATRYHHKQCLLDLLDTAPIPKLKVVPKSLGSESLVKDLESLLSDKE